MEILNHLINIFTHYGYIAVFIALIICGLGMPIPEDVALIAGGTICGLSLSQPCPLNIYYMIIVALFGVLVGDCVMFTIGRKLGSRVTKVPYLKRIITPTMYSKIQEKIHRYGHKILFIARFLPGLRATIFITAGVSHKVPLWKFLLLDGSAALISVPLWVYLGYYFADDIDEVIKKILHFESIFLWALAIVVILTFIIHKIIKKIIKKKFDE